MNIKDQLDLLIAIGFILTTIVSALAILMYSHRRKPQQAGDPGVSVVHLPNNGSGYNNYSLVGRDGNVIDSWAGPEKD